MAPEDRASRVLVADGDPSSLRLLARLLSDARYEVFSASSGLEAFRLLLEHGPRLVIADWNMPEMGGFELCRAIRESEGVGFVYVIIIAALPEREYEIGAFQAGADDCIAKPVDKDVFLARLSSAQRMIDLQADLDRRNREVHLANAKMAVAARELEAVNKRLKILATTDELTGLYNRREAITRLAREWASAQRRGESLSCIVVDIDHFKRFNDTHGHAVGDLVLRETAHTLRRLARAEEDVCRVGGEEFLVICRRSTCPQAAAAAERLRAAVEAHATPHGDDNLTVTVSLGVAARTPATKSPDDLLRAADGALYAAKAAGRNCARVAQESTLSSTA